MWEDTIVSHTLCHVSGMLLNLPVTCSSVGSMLILKLVA